MTNFEYLADAHAAIRTMEFAHWAILPAEVQDILTRTATLGTSPVDRIVMTAEAIYAFREAVPEAAREVAAGLFELASRNGWHGLNTDDRATKAIAVLSGEEVEDAPAPRPDIRQPEPVVIPATE